MPLSAETQKFPQVKEWSIPDYLKDLTATEPRTLAELVTLYLQDTNTNFEKLAEQLELSDSRLIGMTLHAMKGSCRQVGALRLGDLIEQQEEQLQAGGVDAMRPCTHELLRSFALLRSEMEHYLSSQKDFDN